MLVRSMTGTDNGICSVHQLSQQTQNQSKTTSEKASLQKGWTSECQHYSEQYKYNCLIDATGSGQYRYLQEMPTTKDVGMTGSSLAGNKVDFISAKEFDLPTQAERGRWIDCGEFAGKGTTAPLYEVE